MSEFGETLARYRSEAGLNQRELGAAIGLDHTQLNKVERGHRPPLGAKYMKPLVRALRLSRSEALDLVQKADLSPKVLDFMDEVADGQALGQGQQAISPPRPTTLNPALELPESVFNTVEEEVEEIRDLIASIRLTDDEEEIVKSALDTAKRLLKFIAAQRKI
jgi:transcriptional regulator with XRE-family HTH domain